MNENVLAAILGSYETKALVWIVPLYNPDHLDHRICSTRCEHGLAL
jgi:hypothetical protein